MNFQSVIAELSRLTAENQKGVTALFDAEVALAEADSELDRAEQMAFLKAHGTVRDKEAIARLEVADLRLKRDIKRAEFNRIKSKIKAIEQAQLALSVQSKLMQSEARL